MVLDLYDSRAMVMVPMVFVNDSFHHCLIALLSVTLPVSCHFYERSIKFVILDFIDFSGSSAINQIPECDLLFFVIRIILRSSIC